MSPTSGATRMRSATVISGGVSDRSGSATASVVSRGGGATAPVVSSLIAAGCAGGCGTVPVACGKIDQMIAMQMGEQQQVDRRDPHAKRGGETHQERRRHRAVALADADRRRRRQTLRAAPCGMRADIGANSRWRIRQIDRNARVERRGPRHVERHHRRRVVDAHDGVALGAGARLGAWPRRDEGRRRGVVLGQHERRVEATELGQSGEALWLQTEVADEARRLFERLLGDGGDLGGAVVVDIPVEPHLGQRIGRSAVHRDLDLGAGVRDVGELDLGVEDLVTRQENGNLGGRLQPVCQRLEARVHILAAERLASLFTPDVTLPAHQPDGCHGQIQTPSHRHARSHITRVALRHAQDVGYCGLPPIFSRRDFRACEGPRRAGNSGLTQGGFTCGFS